MASTAQAGCCSVVTGALALRLEGKELLSQYPHKEGGTGLSAIFHQKDVPAARYLPSSRNAYLHSGTATHPDSPSIDSADGEPGSYKSLEIHLTHPIRLSQLGIYYWAKNKLPGTVSAVAPDTVKTPSWTEAPDKKHLVGNDRGLEILPEPVAEAMLDLCENPKYSNGTILEVMNDHRRVVPLFNADSPPPKADMPGLVTITTDLLEKLKKDRLDA
ncbi:short chain dehydrogenase [Xylaria longipes]|nr:short chain dehydrogenase [Xylaria longipes]